MVVLGTTIREFHGATWNGAGTLLDPRAKHEDDGVRFQRSKLLTGRPPSSPPASPCAGPAGWSASPGPSPAPTTAAARCRAGAAATAPWSSDPAAPRGPGTSPRSEE